MKIEVLVKLATPDPWSFTVLDALTRKFGFDEILRIERIKSWELVFNVSNQNLAFDITKRLLSDTALLINPNRDIWFVRAARQEMVPQSFSRRPSAAAHAFVVKVTDREDIVGRSMAAIVKSRLGIGEVEDVCFSTIWVLEISRQVQASEMLAREIAIARSWRKGLLANPHFQDGSVYNAESYFAREGSTA